MGAGHPIPKGHIFVEFFFFLTGYFTYAHVRNSCKEQEHRLLADGDTVKYPLSDADRPPHAAHIAECPLRYTFRKLGRLFPYMVITAIGYYFLVIVYQVRVLGPGAIADTIKTFTGAPFDLLLLQVTGICANSQFNAWWYLSGLLFVLPLVMIIFLGGGREEGNALSLWTMYAVPFLIYGYFAGTYSDLNWDIRIGVFNTGILRSFAGLCMGGILYRFTEKIASACLKPWQKIALTVSEAVLYLSAVLFAWKYPECVNSTFLILFCMFGGLCITFSGLSCSRLLNFRFFGWLGKLAMPLYICHYSVGRIVYLYTADKLGSTGRYLLYFGLSVLYAVMMMAAVKAGNKIRSGVCR